MCLRFNWIGPHEIKAFLQALNRESSKKCKGSLYGNMNRYSLNLIPSINMTVTVFN